MMFLDVTIISIISWQLESSCYDRCSTSDSSSSPSYSVDGENRKFSIPLSQFLQKLPSTCNAWRRSRASPLEMVAQCGRRLLRIPQKENLAATAVFGDVYLCSLIMSYVPLSQRIKSALVNRTTLDLLSAPWTYAPQDIKLQVEGTAKNITYKVRTSAKFAWTCVKAHQLVGLFSNAYEIEVTGLVTLDVIKAMRSAHAVCRLSLKNWLVFGSQYEQCFENTSKLIQEFRSRNSHYANLLGLLHNKVSISGYMHPISSLVGATHLVSEVHLYSDDGLHKLRPQGLPFRSLESLSLTTYTTANRCLLQLVKSPLRRVDIRFRLGAQYDDEPVSTEERQHSHNREMTHEELRQLRGVLRGLETLHLVVEDASSKGLSQLFRDFVQEVPTILKHVDVNFINCANNSKEQQMKIKDYWNIKDIL